MKKLIGRLLGRQRESDHLDPQAFGNLLLQEMSQTLPDLRYEPIEDDFGVMVSMPGTDFQGQAYFGNVYQAYLKQPDQLDDLIANYIHTLAQAAAAQAPQDTDIEKLVVLLRPQAYIEVAGDELITRPFTGDMCMVLMEDSSTSLRSIKAEDLSPIGLTEEDAFERALENLHHMIGPLTTEDLSGMKFVTAESGLALGQPILEARQTNAPPKAIFIHDRNAYFEVTLDTPEAGEMLLQYADALMAREETFSNMVLFFEEGEWRAVTPSAT